MAANGYVSEAFRTILQGQDFASYDVLEDAVGRFSEEIGYRFKVVCTRKFVAGSSNLDRSLTSMPHAITIERHKLNQGMYQKLKKFIMNKRKREAEERAQDDYYKRLRKEREERKRQTKLFAESLENTRREIIETRKRVETLKAERNALFTRLKQLSQASAMREKAKRASLLLVPEMQARTFGPTYQADTLSSAGTLQLGKAPAQFQFRPGHQAPVLSNTQPTAQVMGPLSYTDKQMLAVVFPPQTRPKNIPGQELKPASEGPGVMLNPPNSQAANEISQQDFKNFSKCLMGYATVGGKLPTETDLSSLTTLMIQSKLLNASNSAAHQLAAAQAGAVGQSLLNPAAVAGLGPHNAAAAAGLMPTFLPPAPTSYRGSITTGQSAQQIHLQQLAQAQVQQQQQQRYAGDAAAAAAALVEAYAAQQQHQQQQQQHSNLGGPSR